MGQRYDLEDRLIDFAAAICRLLDGFPKTAVARHAITQLMRCATSPFASYAEAQAAESRQDFIHKLKICLKELRETQVWLKFAKRMNLYPESSEAVWRECDELVAIFVASVRTARRRVKMSNVE